MAQCVANHLNHKLVDANNDNDNAKSWHPGKGAPERTQKDQTAGNKVQVEEGLQQFDMEAGPQMQH